MVVLSNYEKVGWKWNNEGLDKIITLHWIIYIVIYWMFIFIFYKYFFENNIPSIKNKIFIKIKKELLKYIFLT